MLYYVFPAHINFNNACQVLQCSLSSALLKMNVYPSLFPSMPHAGTEVSSGARAVRKRKKYTLWNVLEG